MCIFKTLYQTFASKFANVFIATSHTAEFVHSNDKFMVCLAIVVKPLPPTYISQISHNQFLFRCFRIVYYDPDSLYVVYQCLVL